MWFLRCFLVLTTIPQVFASQVIPRTVLVPTIALIILILLLILSKELRFDPIPKLLFIFPILFSIVFGLSILVIVGLLTFVFFLISLLPRSKIHPGKFTKSGFFGGTGLFNSGGFGKIKK